MTAPAWSWVPLAACRRPGVDTDVFFGPDFERQAERDKREAAAKAVCAGCPVRLQCLQYAVGRPEKSGVWGGFSEEERAAERRRRMRRQRGYAA